MGGHVFSPPTRGPTGKLARACLRAFADSEKAPLRLASGHGRLGPITGSMHLALSHGGSGRPLGHSAGCWAGIMMSENQPALTLMVSDLGRVTNLT